MVAVKTSKGWQIRLESGKLLPKVYSSKEEAEKRIKQLIMFREMKKGKESDYAVENGRIKTIFKADVVESDAKKAKIGGTVLTVGKSRNGILYSKENILENNGKKGKLFIEEHGYLRVSNVVGNYTLRVDENEVLKFDGVIRNTHNHPDIVEHAINGDIDWSIDARYKKRNYVKESDAYSIEGLDIRAICGVGVGGIVDNSTDYVIAESFKMYDELNESEEFKCECIKCGYQMTSTKHCNDIKCPKCGGQMRRVGRPGPGQEAEQKFEPPEGGDLPAKAKSILAKAYTAYRKKGFDKQKASKAAWGAVKNAGWKKNKDGKWIHEVEQMSEENAIKEAEKKIETEKILKEKENKIKELEEKLNKIKEAERKKLIDEIIELNKKHNGTLQEKELVKKPEEVLNTIKEYEQKLVEQEEKKDNEEGVGEQLEKGVGVNEKDTGKVVYEKDSGTIRMDSKMYNQFRKELRERIPILD